VPGLAPLVARSRDLRFAPTRAQLRAVEAKAEAEERTLNEILPCRDS
jgi:hypothetical protein